VRKVEKERKEGEKWREKCEREVWKGRREENEKGREKKRE